MAQDKTICKTCGIKLTEENRHKKEVRHCKDCIKVKRRAYFDKNKEEILRKSAERIKNNRPRYNEYNRKQRENPEVREANRLRSAAYYQEHKEEVNKWKSQYYQENKEQALEQNRAYRKANPEKVKSYSLNYRSKKKGLEGKFTAEDIEEMWLEQLGKCVYCKCGLHDNYEVDHIIPVTREGSTNWPSNLQLLCPACNSSKGNKTHEEYLEYQAKYNTRPVVL